MQINIEKRHLVIFGLIIAGLIVIVSGIFVIAYNSAGNPAVFGHSANEIEGLNQIMIVVDQKPAGTNGGTFTSGDWRTRNLTTIKYNSITGASLSNNRITLPAGTYYIRASAPAYSNDEDLNNHKIKLRNVNDNTDVIIGTSEYARGMGYGGDYAHLTTRSFLEGVFTISSTKSFEIQHRCSSTGSFGVASNFGVDEIYTQVFIQKIG